MRTVCAVQPGEGLPTDAAQQPWEVVCDPLRVMFLHTSGFVGGAETLMLNLIRRMDRGRFSPEFCCLKELGPVGDALSHEIPTFERLLKHKYDFGVVGRLTRLMRQRRVDALVVVGAGDKMFWGRLAAWRAGVPVVLCAIHSTGWPDRIGRLNRALTPLTDRFIAVAPTHGRYLVEQERFPKDRVCVIPNGVDTERFQPRPPDSSLRDQLGIPPGPVAGTVARLSSEKNIKLFLESAALARRQVPNAQFVIVGDGPLREKLIAQAGELGVAGCVHFLGLRFDVPQLLGLMDVFLLTSHIEANPVSVLEAIASGIPVVATRVGSVPETVQDGAGFLVDPGDAEAIARRLVQLWADPSLLRSMGQAGRELVVRDWSLQAMVEQYQNLIEEIYGQKRLGDIKQPITVPRLAVGPIQES